MSKARSSAADFIKLIDAEPEIDADDQSGTVIERSSGHLRFRDIRFRYPTRPHVPVLRGLNIEVHPGQYVAVVGASGSGKSTLIQLTERFYDPLVGTVELDGQDVSKLNLRSFRNQISLVSQEPVRRSLADHPIGGCMRAHQSFDCRPCTQEPYVSTSRSEL